MKNFRKLFGIAALAAVIVLCLAFTACGMGQEYTYRFENESPFVIVVSSSDFDPSVFEIPFPALESAPTVPSKFAETVVKEAKSKKSRVSSAFWSVKGLSASESDERVKVEVSGTSIVFKSKGSDWGSWNVEQAQE